MKTLYILMHCGLGDHLICNGIIRTHASKYNKIVLNTLPNIADNVKYMYRDLNNIEYIELHYAHVMSYVQNNPHNNYLILGCTSEYFSKITEHFYPSFDYGFYVMANLPHEIRWNNFFLQRDFEKELDVYYNVLKLKDGEEYIFIHEDSSRKRLLNRKVMPKGIKEINTDNHKDIRIFDLIYTIKNAKEIHVMDSCFLALIDNLQVNHNRLFLHNYGCNRVGFQTYVKMNWKIYNR